MAHYAEINSSNVVVQVITGNNEASGGGLEQDPLYWEKYYTQKTGKTYIKTSYNTRGNVHLLGGTPFRKNYAGIGYKYDIEKDAFIPPKPYNSWVLNNDTCLWEPPTPAPDNGIYTWDEETTSWIQQT